VERLPCKQFSAAKNPARNSPKENSGASGGFLPRPLLLRLRHQNSKKNQPKFCQILPPENSFGKTSSALAPPPAQSIEGRTPKKNVLSFLEEKIGRAQIRKARNIFLWCPPYSAGGGADLFVQFPLEKSSSKVYNYSTRSNLFGIRNMERFCLPVRQAGGSQNRALIFAKTLSAYGGSREIP